MQVKQIIYKMKSVKHIIKNIFIKEPSSTFIIDGVFEKSNDCVFENVYIKVGSKAKLTIAKGVKILNFRISIEEGELIIGENSMLHQANNSLIPRIDISKGSLIIGNNNVIRADFSIRYGGECKIGNYNCLNERTEVRCDEKIYIGDFNMISYDCMIYDTNTHVMYPSEKRRELTKKDFPDIGSEYEKPITKPVSIGSDCWFGKRAVVLKGCDIGNNSVVSTCCVVTKNVPENHLAFGNPSQVKPKS
jgi:acetyltransferase-like isoleucine patch superfamily enzyme